MARARQKMTNHKAVLEKGVITGASTRRNYRPGLLAAASGSSGVYCIQTFGGVRVGCRCMKSPEGQSWILGAIAFRGGGCLGCN